MSDMKKKSELYADLYNIQYNVCRKLRSRVQRLLCTRWILASPFFGLNETLLFRPWPIQNIYLCLSYCYINVSSFIHSGTTNSVNVVCFKAFMHESNSNLCSTACWGLCNSLQHFLDRQIMDEVSRIWHSLFSPVHQTEKWTDNFIFSCIYVQTHCLFVFKRLCDSC